MTSYYDDCLQVDPGGAIIKLEVPCPWTDHLFELEEEMNLTGQIKFVLYSESERGRWRIQVLCLVRGACHEVYSIILVCSSLSRIIH